MSTVPSFCVNCQHHALQSDVAKKHTILPDFFQPIHNAEHLCMRDTAVDEETTDLVTGTTSLHCVKVCSYERDRSCATCFKLTGRDICGIEGQYFQDVN